MDKIHIASWLLTRRCNLKCEYCRISRNYKYPEGYKPLSEYARNEMTTGYILAALKSLKAHNPDMFHIFYGGEPLLREDLPDIINFCNNERIYYTIITNNSEAVQLKIEKLLKETEHIEGLTSSIDPIIFDETAGGDRVEKSIQGLKRLVQYKGYINDLVAEITVDRKTIDFLYPLVEKLTALGINSDITVIDIAKNDYYDFSNVTDESLLVPQEPRVMEIFQKIIDDKLDVHMADQLLPRIYDSLPSNLECGNCDNLHNLTIDADGSVRLCLRIRGTETQLFRIHDYIDMNGTISPELKANMILDKIIHCQLCNWTCQIMSQLISQSSKNVDELVHSERRNQ